MTHDTAGHTWESCGDCHWDAHPEALFQFVALAFALLALAYLVIWQQWAVRRLACTK